MHMYRRIQALAAGDSMPMVSAGDRAPDYLCMDDVDEDIVTLDDESELRESESEFVCGGERGSDGEGVCVREVCVWMLTRILSRSMMRVS